MLNDRSSVRRVLRVAGMAACVVSARETMGQCGYSFNTPIPYNAGNLPRALALADLNNDGRPEIIVANSAGAAQLTVLVGNPDGTFQTQQVWSSLGAVTGIAVADFNGDLRPDVAVCSGSQVLVHTNLAGGPSGFTFTNGAFFNLAASCQWIGSADLNGDGLLDLAVLTSAPNTAAWVRNIGGGSFAPPVSQGFGTVPTSGALADLSQDSRPDLVIANSAAGTVTVMNNTGSGFQPPVSYPASPQPRVLVLDDFNQDGIKDVAVALSGVAALAILLNNGSGALLPQPQLSSLPNPQAVTTTDFDGNLKPDLVVAGAFFLGIHLGTANGTFEGLSGLTSIPSQAVSLAARDLNNDGIPDTVFTSGGGLVYVALGRYREAVQITQQPSNLTVGVGQPATMSIGVNSATGIGFQWRRNGTALGNVGTVSGVNTPTLSISGALTGDVGAYDCRVTGGCSNADFLSNPAGLSVNTCYANCDNSTLAPVLNVSDFSCFLQKYAAGCP